MGISRATASKWVNRYRRYGFSALCQAASVPGVMRIEPGESFVVNFLDRPDAVELTRAPLPGRLVWARRRAWFASFQQQRVVLPVVTVDPDGAVAVPDLESLGLSGGFPVWPADLEHHPASRRAPPRNSFHQGRGSRAGQTTVVATPALLCPVLVLHDAVL